MFLMKNIPLDFQQRFIARSYEVLKSPFNARCEMRQALCVRCANTYVPRWTQISIPRVSRTLSVTIVDFCGNCFLIYVSLLPLQVVKWIGWREEVG